MSDRMTDSEKKKILGIFEAFSSEARLDIFRLLVTFEPNGLVAGEISEKLSIPPTNLSFHLKTLSYAGLLTVEPQGRFIRYRARVDQARRVVDYLTQNCCDNHPDRCVPKKN
jgi:DNA-binding transcriptional ArsR family regulator